MRKKGKLYTANKWNLPLFMPSQNLFGLGDLMNQVAPEGVNFQYQTSIPQQDSPLSTDKVPRQSAPINTNQGGFNWGSVGKGAAAAAAFVPSNEITLNKGQEDEMKLQRGAWDLADPMYWVTGGEKGYKSELGENLSNTGVALTKSGDPWLMLAGAGLKIGGDFANAIGGTKTDEREAQLKDNINYLAGFNSNAGYYDGLERATPMGYSDMYSYHNRWANRKTRQKVREQNAALKRDYDNAVTWAENSYLNNLHNIQQNQFDNALRNYSAYGGNIEMINNDDMGPAINYGFMVDYIAAKQKQAEAKTNNMTNMFAGIPATMFAKGGSIHINPKNKGKFNATKKRTGKTTEQLTHSKNPLTRKRAIFAQNARKWHHALGGPIYLGSVPQAGIFGLGGDIEMHGGDFTDGLVQVNAGMSHETNPNEGVQMGVDPQGTPNLVEEGETIYNDYVFSNRIEADAETLKRFGVSPKTKKTFAELSKWLEHKMEVDEKPNDPIAQAGFKTEIAALADEQERQKQEMEAQKAQEAFNALSPEEQVALMNGAQESIVENPQVDAYGGNLYQEGGKMFADNLPDTLGTDSIAIVNALAQAKNLSADDVNIQNEAREIRNARAKVYRKYMAEVWLTNDPRFQNLKEETIDKLADVMSSPSAYSSAAGEDVDKYDPEKAFKEVVPNVGHARDAGYTRRLEPFIKLDFDENDLKVILEANPPRNRNLAENYLHNDVPKYIKAYQERGQQKDTKASIEASQEEASRERKPGIFGQAIMNTSTTPYGTQYTGAYKQTGAPIDASAYAAEVTPEAPVVTAPETVQTEPVVTTQSSAAPVVNKKDTRYSYYTDVNGEEFPGFTIGEKGIVNNYTPEYDELVNSLKADDLRAWAKDHADDLSYASFRNNGNDITKVTDEEFRKGAHDNKYGFMHYVANSMLQDKLRNEAAQQQASLDTTPSGDVFENVLVNDDGTYTSLGVEPIDENLYNLDQTLPPEYGGVKIWRKKPVETAASEASEVPPTEESLGEDTTGRNVIPVHRNENLRYVGLAGPLVGLGMMQMGIGKPDYSEMDAAVRMAKQAPDLAGYKTIGNYLTYRPMDIWAEQNALNAQARATERALANSNSPSRYAGLLANAYNSQLASGELFRKALEYNDAKKAQVEEFNRGTDQYNAEAFNRTSQMNAELKNRSRQYASSMGLQAAAHKLANDASWYNSLYGNVNSLFKGASELGRENATRNTTADMAAAGLFGVIDPDYFNPNGLLRWETEEERKKRTGSSKACGGKLKK